MSDAPPVAKVCAICAFAKANAFYIIAAGAVLVAYVLYRKKQEMNKEA